MVVDVGVDVAVDVAVHHTEQRSKYEVPRSWDSGPRIANTNPKWGRPRGYAPGGGDVGV